MYEWREDIIDVIDSYDIPRDTKDDLLYRAGQRIVEENGLDYYDCDEDEAAMEEMGDIINLFAIPLDSTLYELLIEWYDNDEEQLMQSIRNAFTDMDNLYFVSGANYALYDKDLLGGSGNGVTQDRFEDFVRERY